MGTYFENAGQPDIRAITEMQYRLNGKITWIWVGAYLLLTVYFLRNFLLGYIGLLLPVMCFGFAVYFALMPYLQVRKNRKRVLKFYNGTLPVNVIRFGENILIENADSSRTWEYHHLVKVHSFKYSYCLRFADKTVLLLDRSEFTKGTFPEFKEFLRTKRPDLKIPE